MRLRGIGDLLGKKSTLKTLLTVAALAYLVLVGYVHNRSNLKYIYQVNDIIFSESKNLDVSELHKVGKTKAILANLLTDGYNKLNGKSEGLKSGLLPINDLSTFYSALGCKVINMTNVEILNTLVDPNKRSTDVSKMLESTFGYSQKLDTNFPQVVMTYPNFNLTIPHFLDEKDREIFLSVQPYQDAMSPKQPERLTGIIALLSNGSVTQSNKCGWTNNITIYNKKVQLSSSKDYYGKDIIIPLYVPDGFAFQHFLDGIMPKLAQVSSFLSHPKVKVMLPRPREKIILEIMQQMGVPPDRVILQSNVRAYSVMQYQLNTCITPPTHPILWNHGRELMGVQKHLQVQLSEANVILLTRAKSHNGGRNIKNLQEVIHYLLQRYNKTLVIFKGGYNLEQAKELFGKARLVMGVHGGAFYNINFCPVETAVVEFMPATRERPMPRGLSHGIVWSMATMINQRYYRTYEKPLNNVGDVQISLPKLRLLLNDIDSYQFKKNVTLETNLR